jgi:cold shock CspA family protein
MSQKLEGVIVHFQPQQGFGFITHRDPQTNRVEKFFLHYSRIISSEVDQDEIRVGYFVRFIASDVPPKREGMARYALDVEIFIQRPGSDHAITPVVPYDGHHWTDGTDQNTKGCRLCQPQQVDPQVGGVK